MTSLFMGCGNAYASNIVILNMHRVCEAYWTSCCTQPRTRHPPLFQKRILGAATPSLLPDTYAVCSQSPSKLASFISQSSVTSRLCKVIKIMHIFAIFFSRFAKLVELRSSLQQYVCPNTVKLYIFVKYTKIIQTLVMKKHTKYTSRVKILDIK